MSEELDLAVTLPQQAWSTVLLALSSASCDYYERGLHYSSDEMDRVHDIISSYIAAEEGLDEQADEVRRRLEMI